MSEKYNVTRAACEAISARLRSLRSNIDFAMCLGNTLREVFECTHEHHEVAILTAQYHSLECDKELSNGSYAPMK